MLYANQAMNLISHWVSSAVLNPDHEDAAQCVFILFFNNNKTLILCACLIACNIQWQAVVDVSLWQCVILNQVSTCRYFSDYHACNTKNQRKHISCKEFTWQESSSVINSSVIASVCYPQMHTFTQVHHYYHGQPTSCNKYNHTLPATASELVK